MPKHNVIKVKIPIEQPDCCTLCPLLGLIPKWRLERGSQETYICVATRHAMTARASRSKASAHDAKHPLHRSCDPFYHLWAEKGWRGIPAAAYNEERLPYEENQQLPIIFHSKRGPKTKEN